VKFVATIALFIGSKFIEGLFYLFYY